MNALFEALKRLHYRTLIVLTLIGLLLVPTIAIAITFDLPGGSGEAVDVVAGGPIGVPEPGPDAWTDGFVWGG